MKKVSLIAVIALMAVACKNEQPPKDYAVIHGTITNPGKENTLRLYDPISSKSVQISVSEDGKFRDTLKLDDPTYYNGVYSNVFGLYLANDMDLEINFDAENINQSINYKGKGANENEYLQYKTKKSSELMGENYQEYLGMETSAFDAKTSAYSDDLLKRLESQKADLHEDFIASEKENIKKFEEDIHMLHEQQLQINESLSPGKPSPEFKDYVDVKGGTKSLADFRGKYVYIDVWATWCVPCIYEMPYMKEVEEAYKGKNIHFLGISIDRKKDEDKWRKMIEEKDLGGTQLLADNEIESEFIRDYYIQGIPRFILLDPEGNIVRYDAPRPSEDRLIELFDSLEI